MLKNLIISALFGAIVIGAAVAGSPTTSSRALETCCGSGSSCCTQACCDASGKCLSECDASCLATCEVAKTDSACH